MKVAIGFGIMSGAVILAQNFWLTIERPLVHFVMLGIIPGTDVALTFEDVLLLGLVFFLSWGLLEEIGYRRSITPTPAKSFRLTTLRILYKNFKELCKLAVVYIRHQISFKPGEVKH